MANILVTGGCGFIGSHLVDRLANEGHDVFIVDDLSIGKKLTTKIRGAIYKNITDVYEERDVYMFGKMDVIFHLAAESRVQPSLENPTKTFNTNITGTACMCELARFWNCKLIYAGSSTAEEQFLNPYAFSKFKGEEICKMYDEVYGLKMAIARFFNVYGEGHYRKGSYATVLGIFEEQYMNGEPLTITGNGEQRRDFVHVNDIVDGLIKLIDVCNGETYNFGKGKNYSINEIASFFDTEIRYIERPFGEMQDTIADINKTVDELGFNPKREVKDYVDNWKNHTKKCI